MNVFKDGSEEIADNLDQNNAGGEISSDFLLKQMYSLYPGNGPISRVISEVQDKLNQENANLVDIFFDVIANHNQDTADKLLYRVKEVWGEDYADTFEISDDDLFQSIINTNCFTEVQQKNPLLGNFLQFILNESYYGAVDSGHGLSHILAILQEFDSKLSDLEEIGKINKEEFVAMVVLHDVYTAGKDKTKAIEIAKGYWIDGGGSVELINSTLLPKYIEKMMLDPEIQIESDKLEDYIGLNRESFDRILYEVKKHSVHAKRLISGNDSLEGRIFYYFDTMDLNSPFRIFALAKSSLGFLSKIVNSQYIPETGKRMIFATIIQAIHQIYVINNKTLISKDLQNVFNGDFTKRLNLSLDIISAMLSAMEVNIKWDEHYIKNVIEDDHDMVWDRLKQVLRIFSPKTKESV